MPTALIKCGNCGGELLRDYGNKRKLRTSILIFEGERCTAKCPKCQADVAVPLILGPVPESRKHTPVRHVVEMK